MWQSLDYAAWIEPNWQRRTRSYFEAVRAAVLRVAKTRLTESERNELIGIADRACMEIQVSPPDVVIPLNPIRLTYYEGNDRPGISFGSPSGIDISLPGVTYVEVKPEDAFGVAASLSPRKEELPAIARMFMRDASGLHFYEAFPYEGRIVEHEGLCGVGGDNRFHTYETVREAGLIVAKLKSAAKAKGYHSLPASKQKRLIIEYVVTDRFANGMELDFRHEVEDFLNDLTGRLGLGYCDGGSSGQGTMEICCFVVDFKLAQTAIERELADTRFANYSRIYLET